LWVYGDADLLRAAFRNVLENAARHAPGEPPTVRVEASAEDVRVVVSDRGPGVPEAERERIFQPLTRLDPARTVGGAADGFGLGLATARSAARAFGGDLVCRGRADAAAGAEFVFTLRRSSPPDAVASAPLEASNANLSSL
jgi:signal transduction histidine kinase